MAQFYGVGIDDLDRNRKAGVIDGTMDSEVYVNILSKISWPQLENANWKTFYYPTRHNPKHMSKNAKEFSSRSKLNYLNGRLKVLISTQLNIRGLFWIKKLVHDVLKREKSRRWSSKKLEFILTQIR